MIGLLQRADYKRDDPINFAGRMVFSMKQYDAKCPVCGTLNRGLYLEETDGWMECEHCHETVLVQEYITMKKTSVLNIGRITVRRVTASA